MTLIRNHYPAKAHALNRYDSEGRIIGAYIMRVNRDNRATLSALRRVNWPTSASLPEGIEVWHRPPWWHRLLRWFRGWGMV